jgi:hypothetical protein
MFNRGFVSNVTVLTDSFQHLRPAKENESTAACLYTCMSQGICHDNPPLRVTGFANHLERKWAQPCTKHAQRMEQIEL